MAFYNLALVTCARGDWSAGQPLVQTSLRISTEIGDTFTEGVSYCLLGDIARAAGDHATAQQHYTASLVRSRAVGHRQAIASGLFGLGHVALESGEPGTASARFREGLTLARAMGLRLQIAAGLEASGALAARTGEPTHAVELIGAADALRATIGAPRSRGAGELLHSSLRDGTRVLGQAAAAVALHRGRTMGLDSAIALAMAPDLTAPSLHQLPGLGNEIRVD